MLSKLSRRGVAALRRRPAVLSQLACIRKMSTAQKEESLMDIVKEYGTLPLVGAGTAVLLGKEIFMLNEEVYVAGCFAAACFLLYVGTYEPATEAFNAMADDVYKEQVAMREAKIAQLEERAQMHREYTQVSAEMKNMFDYYETCRVNYAAAMNRASEMAVVNKIEGELEDLYQAEAFITANTNEKILEKAKASLGKYLEKVPKKESEDYFKWALGMLEGKSDPTEESFVIKQFQKEIDAEIEKVKKYDAKAAMDRLKKLEAEGLIDPDADGALKTARKLASM